MFSLEDAYTNITLDSIMARVSEYELWRYYCHNFESFDKPFLSEFYNDSNPDCRLYKAPDNRLKYKDFGTGECLSVLEYIMKKYGCTFKECLTIIATDFNLAKSSIIVNKETKLLNFGESDKIRKSRIDIISQPWNYTDFTYWNQYKIPLTLLQEYNVFSCKNVYLFKGNKITSYNYSKSNPIYAYRFDGDDGYVYKICFPYTSNKEFKWLYSGTAANIEGFDQLSLNGKLLILTKSLKDCMVYRMLGYDAISLQGECNRLDPEFVHKLLKRFDTILVNYDNDVAGKANTERLHKEYGFKYFYIDEAKDISDYMKIHSVEEAKDMVMKKMEEVDE